MEDTEIARKLIGKIIGQSVEQLTVRPQELATESPKHGILIYRLDFKATIKTEEGDYKTVLIELQKAKVYDDLLRFRRYLGDNYKKQDEVILNSGLTEKKTLPITTIYIIGFPLPNVETSILKINRDYIDLISGERLNIRTEFVEKLTHDSYIILIPKLPSKERTELEGILRVFDQSYRLDGDSKILEIKESDFAQNALAQQIVNRLRRGATDESILRNMEIEEEVEQTIDQHIREKEELKEKLAETVKSKDEAIKSKDEAIKSKDEAIKSKNEAIQKQNQIIEELKRQLKDKGN